MPPAPIQTSPLISVDMREQYHKTMIQSLPLLDTIIRQPKTITRDASWLAPGLFTTRPPKILKQLHWFQSFHRSEEKLPSKSFCPPPPLFFKRMPLWTISLRWSGRAFTQFGTGHIIGCPYPFLLSLVTECTQYNSWTRICQHTLYIWL